MRLIASAALPRLRARPLRHRALWLCRRLHHPEVLTSPSVLPRFVRSIVTHISPTTSLLRSDTTDNEVYLLGTAHVSDASTQEVVDLIRLVQPQVVFVELDAARAAHLRNSGGGTASYATESSSPFDLSKLTSHPLLKSGAFGQMPSNFGKVLEAAPALLKRIGWFPPQGWEMRAALEEADRIGARCVYGDVEFNETMGELKSAAGQILTNPRQLANIPSPPGELRDIFSGLSRSQNPQEVVETVKTRENANQMTRYLKQAFPSVYHVMITRRDAHMAKMLRQHCSEGKVVAVVGLAHVEGIEREWEELDGKS